MGRVIGQPHIRQAIYEGLEVERLAQLEKWGEQRHTMQDWLTILAEEFGEVGMAVCKGWVPPVEHPEVDASYEVEKELIQTAAVCVAWLEDIYARREPEQIVDPKLPKDTFVLTGPAVDEVNRCRQMSDRGHGQCTLIRGHQTRDGKDHQYAL